MEGVKGLTDMVSVHFGADLSAYWDDSFFAYHFINGYGSTVFENGTLVPIGPTWGKHSEQWVFHFGFDLNDNNRFPEKKIPYRARELLKIPDLRMKVETQMIEFLAHDIETGFRLDDGTEAPESDPLA